MVEDDPPLRDQPLVRVRVEEEPSSEYPWETWGDLMIALLIIPKNVPDLIDYWKANEAMLGYVQTLKPEVYQRVKSEFTKRKLNLKKD